MNIITRTFYKVKILVFLTFAVDILFLAIDLVWNKYLAKLINLVTAENVAGRPAGNSSLQKILAELLIILAIFIFMSGTNAFVSDATSARFNYELRQNYIESIAYKERAQSGGEMTSVLLNELNAVSAFISENLFFIFNSFIKFIGTFGWFIFLNPCLALSSNLPVFLIILYVSFSSRILKNYTIKTNEENTKLNAVTESLMSLFPVIRLYQAQKFILNNYTSRLEKWEKLNISMEKKKAVLMSISAVMTCIPLLLLVLIGGNLVIKGKMTAGELYIFINLSGNVSGILMNMPSFIMQFRIFAGNLQKISRTGEEQ